MSGRFHMLRSRWMVLILGFGLLMAGCGQENETENPWEYKGAAQKADTRRMFTEEAGTVELSTEVVAICISREDEVFYTDGNKVYQLGPGNGVKVLFSVPENIVCLDVFEKDEIYLGISDHVDVCDANGKLLRRFELDGNALVSSVSVNQKFAAIADAGGKKVWVYTKDGRLSGILDGKELDKQGKGFIVPSASFDVDFDGDGSLWVTNSGKLRVERYTESGQRDFTFGGPSPEVEGFIGCCNPVDISVSSALDGIVTYEKGIDRIKYYSKKGIYLGLVTDGSKLQNQNGKARICVDSRGMVLVADHFKKRIYRFVKIKEYSDENDGYRNR